MALVFQFGQPVRAQPLPGLCPGRLIRTSSCDVCNSTDLPEVEIISLLEEQLPHYKLRADTIYGYDHDDWLHTPLISPDVNIDLTTEQIEETLKYFLLCAERVGQMTKTYNDIDAVTRLLEEKERDLELAARIGQSLLKKNKTLTERNELLEEQVEHIREEVSQLRHELSMKDELLQFYTSAAEESEPESVCSTPLKRNESSSSVQNYFHLDSLQKKLKDLEEENVVLRSEACQLKTETITYEEKEQQLVNDCVKELRDANVQIASISEELAKKTEDAARQQEEITHLLSQIVDLQKKAKACAVENEELVQHLGAAKDAQRQLTAELRELEDKYAECMEMLHEAQEELKNLRNKTMPNTTSRRYHSLGLFPMDSLAAEIEGTMRKELQLEESESPDIAHQKRVFETVRNINQLRQHPPVQLLRQRRQQRGPGQQDQQHHPGNRVSRAGVLPPFTTGSSWPSLTLGAFWTPGLVWSPRASGHWMLTWTKYTALTTLKKTTQEGRRCSGPAGSGDSESWRVQASQWDHLRPRTFAFHLPRPDPVYKPTTLGSACHRPTPPSPSPPAASCILQTSSRGSHQALTRPQLRLVAAPAT
uniref:HAP1 N-terminal domain-containing protein n=1 Tax=Capra hircus TaxID=9925 RepID=A0A8C2P8L9_CAPHI